MATIPQEKTDQAIEELEAATRTDPKDSGQHAAFIKAIKALRDECRGKIEQRVPPGNGVG